MMVSLVCHLVLLLIRKIGMMERKPERNDITWIDEFIYS